SARCFTTPCWRRRSAPISTTVPPSCCGRGSSSAPTRDTTGRPYGRRRRPYDRRRQASAARAGQSGDERARALMAPATSGGRLRAKPRARRSTGVTIRPGGPDDVATILRLIRGLAEYERLAHEVHATSGRLRRHGSGPRPYFETLICRRQGQAVGF